MNLRGFVRLGLLLVGVQVGLAVWGLAQVPPDARVPIHWGPSGEPDGWAPPLVAFLFTPAITIGIAALLWLVPRIEPRRENLRRSADAYRVVAIGIVVFMTAVQAFIVASGVGIAVPVSLVFGVGTGALFIVIGNVMGTVRSNFMFGVRTPWTLASDRAWDRTHRLVGRLFVGGGFLVVATALLLGEAAVVVALLGVIIVVLVVAFGYSYRVWRDDPDRRNLGVDG